MTATGRSGASGHVRHADDFYRTPASCTRSILHAAFPPFTAKFGARVLDPCCGDGAILDVVKQEWPAAETHGIELDKERASIAMERGHNVRSYPDALDDHDWSRNERPHLILMNPPFSLSLEFVERALREVDPFGVVCALLRLNWLASVRRAPFLRAHTPSVYVLPKRPSFTADGRVDAADYGWFCWREGQPIVRILDVEARS